MPQAINNVTQTENTKISPQDYNRFFMAFNFMLLVLSYMGVKRFPDHSHLKRPLLIALPIAMLVYAVTVILHQLSLITNVSYEFINMFTAGLNFFNKVTIEHGGDVVEINNDIVRSVQRAQEVPQRLQELINHRRQELLTLANRQRPSAVITDVEQGRMDNVRFRQQTFGPGMSGS